MASYKYYSHSNKISTASIGPFSRQDRLSLGKSFSHPGGMEDRILDVTLGYLTAVGIQFPHQLGNRCTGDRDNDRGKYFSISSICVNADNKTTYAKIIEKVYF